MRHQNIGIETLRFSQYWQTNDKMYNKIEIDKIAAQITIYCWKTKWAAPNVFQLGTTMLYKWK